MWLLGTVCGNCSVAIELARYVEWFLTSDQAQDAVQYHFMVPVSPAVVERIRSDVLERMTCDGRPLMDMVRQQKYHEAESLKTWKLPVQIASLLIFVIILVPTVYAVQQRVRYVRMLDRDDWKINFFDIDFVVQRKRRCLATSSDADAVERMASSSSNCFGRWCTHDVVTRPLRVAPVLDINRKLKQTLMHMRQEVEHENVARFFGISAHNGAFYLVEQHCADGTLVEFLRANKHSANQSFRHVVCADIANGMAYLHQQNVIHGNLSIDKCHVDSRWTVKIVDWEYTALYDVVRRTDRNRTHVSGEKSVLHFLCDEAEGSGSSISPTFRHLAPEIQKDGLLSEPTRAGDVYSFGVIVQDLFFGSSLLEPQQIDVSHRTHQIIHLACHENSIERPNFQQLEKIMRSAISGRQINLLDRCVKGKG